MANFLTPSERSVFSPSTDLSGMAIPLASLSSVSDIFNDWNPMRVWSTQPSVRKVTDFIAGNVASLPLHVYNRSEEGRIRVRDGHLAELVRSPSQAREETRFLFWKRFLMDWLLWERAALWINPTTDKLVRIPPQKWRPAVNGFGTIDYILVARDDGQVQQFKPEEFILLAGYSGPGFSGVSPVDTLRTSLEETSDALEFRKKMWQRQSSHTGIVKRTDPWSSETARANFLEGLRAFDAAAERQGGTMLLDEGMEWQDRKPPFTPADLEDIEARRLTDIEVCSMFHIAPEMLGSRQGNYSNMEAFRQALYRDNLGPYIDGWEQALEPLAAQFGSQNDYVEAFLDAKLRGAFEDQAKSLQSLVGGPVMTRNEGRAKLNLPNVDGGDELITPLNVLVGGQASPTDVDVHDQFKQGKPRLLVKSAELTPVYGAELSEELTVFFAQQRARVAAAYKLDPDNWWDQNTWDKELGDLLASQTQMMGRDMGRSQAAGLGFNEDDYDADITMNYLQVMGEGRAELVNQKTYEDLLQGLGEGQSVEETFDRLSRVRATTIAAALVTAVAAFTGSEVSKQLMEGRGSKTWIVNSLNPRPSHAAMDGMTVPIGDVFPNGQEWPGDPSAGVDEVAGCMCGVEVTWET